MKDKKIPLIAILLILAIGNFTRIKGTENIRMIEFLSIFVIGAFSGILLNLLITKFKNRG